MTPSSAGLTLSVTPGHPAHKLLEYGVTDSPYGAALWGFTNAGLCHLSLHDPEPEPITILQKRWPGYTCQQHQAQAKALSTQAEHPGAPPITAWAVGTELQNQVWQTLLQLKSGELVSYQWLAQQIGRPDAVRAVGTAVGKNPIAWLIPCHRVIRKNGDTGQYHWGAARKKQMIQAEKAQQTAKGSEFILATQDKKRDNSELSRICVKKTLTNY
mgnify:CR=1 FL=1